MPDPKLKTAMREIEAVLKKHDCAGLIPLVSEKHAEYLYEIAPSWSCARVEETTDKGFGIRIRSKLKDYPSKEAQKKSIEATAGMFLSFANMAAEQQGHMAKLIKMLHGHMGEITHWEKDE